MATNHTVFPLSRACYTSSVISVKLRYCILPRSQTETQRSEPKQMKVKMILTEKYSFSLVFVHVEN